MLTKLSRLSVESDGRYAKEEELDFLFEYLKSQDIRLSAYEKLRTNATEIIDKVEKKIKDLDPTLFVGSAGDLTENWRRDTIVLMRYAAAALLFDDRERLQEGLLLWHNTIVRSHEFDRTCKTVFQLMPDIIKDYLNPDEIAIFAPFLTMNKITLS